jgi:spore coat polysaccharide biosynthesis predicted glycosyltransferase SpsG
MDWNGRGNSTLFALCVESSHARGMGHLYRSLNLAEGLAHAGRPYILYLNEHTPSEQILIERCLPYRIIDFQNLSGNWERDLIRRDDITLWVNDRLDTNLGHAQKIKGEGIPLVTFDDRGTGAMLADLHIAALAFDAQEKIGGLKVLKGADYLILNPKIHEYKRLRKQLKSILVTLGGSDTYGVTVKVVQMLKDMDLTATIVVGPGFMHMDELKDVLTDRFIVKFGVPSMIEEFHDHDLAITGGGITPFEANASGLPCIVIANEMFEIPVGMQLHKLGGSIFAGHHESLRLPFFEGGVSLQKMSLAGMQNIGVHGTKRVISALLELHN